MASYVKNTKENTDFPNANLWFLKTIKEKLSVKGWDKKTSTNNEIVVTITEDYSYCYDTVSLISKTLSDDKWEFKMTKYEVQDNPSNNRTRPKWHVYTWRMNKR